MALVLALAWRVGPAAGDSLAEPAVELEKEVWLPLMTFNPGLYGKVTLHGAPLAGVQLKLLRYNGSAWGSVATTSTDASGRYNFVGAASLTAGQKYVVEYLNSSNSSRLGEWHTRVLTAYTAGSGAHLGDFDVADVVLTAPAPGEAIVFPYTFTWVKRAASPTDSYMVGIFDIADFNPYVTTAPGGWVEHVDTYSLPPGFSTGVTYYWWVEIVRSDGASGTSYWANALCFTACPALGAAGASTLGVPTAALLTDSAGPMEPAATWP